MRQHRAAHAVAHGPDAIDAGVAVRIDHDATVLVELHAGAVGQQALARGLAAHRDQQLVDHDGLLALRVGVGDVDLGILFRVGLDLGLADLGAEPDVQALLLEFLQRGPGHLGIGQREEVGQGFKDRDLGAQTLPHAAQFQADHAGADHAQALGHAGEVQAADVVDDGLAVEPGERQFDRIRTGREDHVAALELDLGTVVLPDLDHVAGVQRAEAVVRGDLVGLEQHRDAAGELLHDLVLAAHHGADVDRGVPGGDAVLAEQVLQVVELPRAVQQRLGRDAAHAQAGAAQRRLAVLAQAGVDAGDLQPQLRGADGGVIAGGAGADDHYVEVLLFHKNFPFYRFPSLSRGGQGWGWVPSGDVAANRSNPSSHIPNSIRCGFSSWFLMSTRNSTASLPSMTRWS